MAEKSITDVELNNISNMDIAELEKEYADIMAKAEYLRIVINQRRDASRKFHSHNTDIAELEKEYTDIMVKAEYLRIVLNRRRDASRKF